MYCDVNALKILRSVVLTLCTFMRVRRGSRLLRGFSMQRGSDRVRHGSVRVQRGSKGAVWLIECGERKNDGINTLNPLSLKIQTKGKRWRSKNKIRMCNSVIAFKKTLF